MRDLITETAHADKNEIAELLQAVLQRYAILYPQWDVSTISLPKSEDRNKQLNGIIHLLQQMKTTP